jgi:SH3 domain protein
MLIIIIKVWRLIIPVTIGLCLMVQTSWADKAYVTDWFRISLRRGPSIENKILKFLPSGLPVEILESQEGWNRVRLLEGEGGALEGWILSRYLVTRLPWKNQARSLREENARLKEKIAHIDEEWAKKVHRELGNTRQLKENHKATLKTVQRLTKENESLRSSQRKKWFVTGALVLLCGLMIGLVVGKRKSSYY